MYLKSDNMPRRKGTSRKGLILDNNNEVKTKEIPASKCEIIVPHFQLIDPLISLPNKKKKTKETKPVVASKTIKQSKSKKKEDDDYLSQLANFTDYVESSSYCGGLAFRNPNRESDNSDDEDDDDHHNSDFNADSDDNDDGEQEVVGVIEEEEEEDTGQNDNNIINNLTNSQTGQLVSLENHNDNNNYIGNNPGSSNTDTTINVITVYCPQPGPKSLVKKTKFTNVLPVKKRETMVQLLRTRTTLCPLTEHDDPDPNQKELQVLDGTLSMIKTGTQSQKWSNTVLKTVQQEPHKLVAENLSEFLKESLVKQAEKEFLYWSFLPDEERKNSSSRYPYWISLLQKSAETHPLWRHYSKHQVEIMIRSGGISALDTVTKIGETANNLVTESLNWINSLDEGMKKTLLFMKKFRILEAEIESKHKNLDEFCHWGKKHLQEMFSPPYFTLSSSDYCHLVDQSHFLENFFDDAIIDVCKQKWTNKDFRSIQKFIKDVIIDAEYAKYVDRYNYLASRIIFERVQRLQEEEERNQAAQEAMPSSSSSSYQRPEKLGLDEFGQAHKKGNSRRKKQKIADCEHAKTTLQRHFKVNLDESNSLSSTVEINANITVKAQDLQTWFHGNESRLRKLTYETLMKEPEYVDLIDWYKVAKKVSFDSGKDRSANDCFLAWKHEAHPSVNTRRWGALEMKTLIDTVQLKLQTEHSIDWNEIAFINGNNRTPYQCFFKYRNRIVQNDIMTWDELKTRNVVDIINNEGAKWRNAVEATGDLRATKHQLQERWKKSSRSILRHGPFTRVEDALLLLTLERLKGFLVKEHTFSILISYLPWRYETVWRDRANHLFSNWIVPWTREEDELLLQLAAGQSGKKNWQEIAGKFSSFKNRKGCLTRHKILRKKIGEGKNFKDLDEYHEGYSMFRKNIFQYKHLQEVVDLFKRVMGQELCEESFPGLSSTSTPEEWELRYMLLDYDRSVMQKTIEHLETYIKSRNEYWKDWMDQNKIIKTFDRRTFHIENPQSVASAVHIKGLKMKNKSEIGRPLTEFEEDVYKYYGRFCRTKALNKDAERRYLPSAKELMKMSEIKDIVEPSSDMELSNDDDNDEPPPKRRRGRQVKQSIAAPIALMPPPPKRRGRSQNKVDTNIIALPPKPIHKGVSQSIAPLVLMPPPSKVTQEITNPPPKRRRRSTVKQSIAAAPLVLMPPPPKVTQTVEKITNPPPKRRGRSQNKSGISLPPKSIHKVVSPVETLNLNSFVTTELQRQPRKEHSSLTPKKRKRSSSTQKIVNIVSHPPTTPLNNESSNGVKLEPIQKRLRSSVKPVLTALPVATTTSTENLPAANKKAIKRPSKKRPCSKTIEFMLQPENKSSSSKQSKSCEVPLQKRPLRQSKKNS